MKLHNRVALVTGAAHGIGLAIARRYVAEGAKVVIADKDREAGPACAVALGHAECRFVATDVSQGESARNAVAIWAVFVLSSVACLLNSVKHFSRYPTARTATSAYSLVLLSRASSATFPKSAWCPSEAG